MRPRHQRAVRPPRHRPHPRRDLLKQSSCSTAHKDTRVPAADIHRLPYQMRKLRVRSFLPLLLIAVQPVAAAGQLTTNTLHPGDEVQVLAPTVRGSRVRGTVVLYQGSTLDVREAATGSVVSIPVDQIRLLARNEGMDRGRSSWRMARLGAFVGGAGGLVAGPLIATSRAPDNFSEVMLASSVAGTAAGAGLGAVLGAVFARDRWQRFRMPIVPTISAEPHELRVGLTLGLR
jgi:hypothetical protein